MSFADLRAALEARFADAWTATPVRWENVRFVEPATAWVAFHVRDGDGRRADIGAAAPRFRHAGTIVLQIFTPAGGGTAAARALADQAAAVFREAALEQGDSGLIRCGVPSLHPVGLQGAWHQVNLTIPFRRDVIAA